MLPNLRPGRSLRVIVGNALRLIFAGAPRGAALALALNQAGFRPADRPSPPDPPAPAPDSST